MRLFFPSGESWLFLMKGNMWSLRSPNHQRLSWNSSLQVMINTDSSLPQRRNNCHANENLWPKTVRRRHWNSYRVACTIFPYIRQLPDVCISIFSILFLLCSTIFSFPYHNEMVCQQMTVQPNKSEMWILPSLEQSIYHRYSNFQFGLPVPNLSSKVKRQSKPPEYTLTVLAIRNDDVPLLARTWSVNTNIYFWAMHFGSRQRNWLLQGNRDVLHVEYKLFWELTVFPNLNSDLRNAPMTLRRTAIIKKN